MTEVPIPKWVDSQSKPNDGLDLLGLRLPVQAISGSLINGVTTISPRVRYLSIRSWIIKMYSESGLPNDSSTLADFTSRVECAIVLGILFHNKDTVYLPGSTNGRLLIDGDDDPIPVQKLVKQTAFRIYAGPSYNLFFSYAGEDGVPGLTEERGLLLASEFDQLIKNTKFHVLLKDDPQFQTVPREVLKELGRSIDVENIPASERNVILNTLIPEAPADKSEVNRIMTYTLLLELSKRHTRMPDEIDLFKVTLHPAPEISEHLMPILEGYLLYTIRDVLAVVHEAILGEICAELKGYDEAVSSNQLINSFLGDDINLALQSIGLLELHESFEQIRFLELVDRVDEALINKTTTRGLTRWGGILDENLLIERVMKNKREAAGLLPVAWLLCKHRIDSEERDLNQHLLLLSHQGHYRMGFKEVILPMLDQWMQENPTLDKVLSWQIRSTVDQHLRIAWSRMFTDVKKDVALLIGDGDFWKPREIDFTGGHTDSRLEEAIGWLEQLGLIDENGLTRVGEDALRRSYQILSQVRTQESDQ